MLRSEYIEKHGMTVSQFNEASKNLPDKFPRFGKMVSSLSFYFSKKELEDILFCFDLDADDFAKDTKEDLIANVIVLFFLTNTLDDLIKKLNFLRPTVNWNVFNERFNLR